MRRITLCLMFMRNFTAQTIALVKDYDSVRDIALLKVDLQNSTPLLKISSTLPRRGEIVIAIGTPRGLSGSVSSGIVSALRQTNNNILVQFTAPISHGSSGGALISLNGEVIGVTSGNWPEENQNLNFAVASTILRQFLSSAINKSARALPRSVPSIIHYVSLH